MTGELSGPLKTLHPAAEARARDRSSGVMELRRGRLAGKFGILILMGESRRGGQRLSTGSEGRKSRGEKRRGATGKLTESCLTES